MKRDLMLMEAILGQLLQSPDPLVGTTTIARRLNVELPVVRHHLQLLRDKGYAHESENEGWRMTNQGHDYVEGSPVDAVSLNLPSR